jgi:hypothetical protein
MLEKIPWSMFFKLPGCAVKKVSSYVVEGRFQFLELRLTLFSIPFHRVYRGNNQDFSKPFIDFLQENGACFEELAFTTRKGFELVAKTRPSLRHIHFDWGNLS